MTRLSRSVPNPVNPPKKAARSTELLKSAFLAASVGYCTSGSTFVSLFILRCDSLFLSPFWNINIFPFHCVNVPIVCFPPWSIVVPVLFTICETLSCYDTYFFLTPLLLFFLVLSRLISAREVSWKIARLITLRILCRDGQILEQREPFDGGGIKMALALFDRERVQLFISMH